MDASELPVVYQITGHGESSLSGGFTEAVEKANITLSQLTLLKEDSIPEDAEAIIINGPTSDFSACSETILCIRKHVFRQMPFFD